MQDGNRQFGSLLATCMRLGMTFVCVTAVLAVPRAHAQDSPPTPSQEQTEDSSGPIDSQADAGRAAASSSSSRREQTDKSSATGSDESVIARPANHPSLTIGNALTLEFTARIQADLRGAAPEADVDRPRVDWQDRRIGVEGTAFKRLDFAVSRELSQDFDRSTGGGVTAWRDAYVDVRVTPALNVEAGRFKLPFGRETLSSKTNLDFAYRSLVVTALSPSRDPGVMVHGRLFAGNVEYQAGYFARDGSNARTSATQGGEDARVVRLVLMPFTTTSVHALVPLQIGVAVADSRLDNRLGIRGRTALGDSIFFDPMYVNGRRARIGWEIAWAMGPVGVSGEYIRVSDERTGMGLAREDLPNVDARGWYIAGTWVLTGERKEQYGRLEPRRALWHGGIGALEVAARVEALGFNTATYPTAESGLPRPLDKTNGVTTLGLNWYVNHYVKLQANMIRESIDDSGRSPAATAADRFTTIVFRVQFRL